MVNKNLTICWKRIQNMFTSKENVYIEWLSETSQSDLWIPNKEKGTLAYGNGIISNREIKCALFWGPFPMLLINRGHKWPKGFGPTQSEPIDNGRRGANDSWEYVVNEVPIQCKFYGNSMALPPIPFNLDSKPAVNCEMSESDWPETPPFDVILARSLWAELEDHIISSISAFPRWIASTYTHLSSALRGGRSRCK